MVEDDSVSCLLSEKEIVGALLKGALDEMLAGLSDRVGMEQVVSLAGRYGSMMTLDAELGRSGVLERIRQIESREPAPGSISWSLSIAIQFSGSCQFYKSLSISRRSWPEESVANLGLRRPQQASQVPRRSHRM